MDRVFRSFVVSSVLVAFAATGTAAQTASSNPASSKPKLTEDVYKNIQTLKGIPADELIPAMQFITYSLGVECGYCHVENAFEKDDKKPKQTARKMMQMMAAIDRDNFDAKQMVTCYSCHRGAPKPVATPIVAEAEIRPALENVPSEGSATVPANIPPVDQIIAKYTEAVGGAQALAKINSRELKGTISLVGRNIPVEIVGKLGNKQLTIVHLPNGDSITAYNGASGWTSAPNRPVHEIPEVEVASARVEADFHLAVDLKHMFSELKSGTPEKIGDREVYVVSGMNAGDVAAKFYFDKESGLLLRILRFAQSPLGQNPTQIDYADYRTQDGVKIPFQQTIARPNSRITVQIDDAKFNGPVDDARFARPVPAAAGVVAPAR
jgi:photosynthetic reaction center cytochrome c subunit